MFDLVQGVEELRITLLDILSLDRHPAVTIGLLLLALLALLKMLSRVIAQIRRCISYLLPQQGQVALRWPGGGIYFGSGPTQLL
ncbi:hypothetical protein PS9374_04549 [Planomonospora sphaerica]|uniref:Uncharacterized protein n=1 Tax=Planomonospora sphaerica TaxID=161355 RepID=A0A161LJ47_9ACTN|nr:hypothetical protein [Planomonospora sphaerica]GAT68884.1 hypothetical protein PS9374_04549 [Planomonospora sphaerica]